MTRPSAAARRRAVPLRELARLLGRHPQTVSGWIAQGCPTVEAARREDGVSWRLDPAAVVEWLTARAARAERDRVEASTRDRIARLEKAAGLAADDADTSFEEARRRKETALARLRELEVAERETVLAPCDGYVSLFAQLARESRDKVLAVPIRTARELARLGTPAECQALLRDALEDALRAISGPDPDELHAAAAAHQPRKG